MFTSSPLQKSRGLALAAATMDAAIIPMSSFPQGEAPRPDSLSYAMEHDLEHDYDENMGEIRVRRQLLSLPLLTVPILGVQTVWSIQMAFGEWENCELGDETAA